LKATLRLRAGPRGDVRLLLAPDTAYSVRALRAWLRPEDLAAARRLRHRGRRRAFLVGRALLRRLVAEHDGIPTGRTRLRLQRARRPLHRATHRRRLALSLSHAGGWVLAAAAPGASAGRQLGVDLEARGRTLSPAVGRRLARDANAARSPRLLDWCLAEAALKADGRGVAALSRLRLSGETRALVLRADMADRRPGALLVLPLHLRPGRLVGALALAPRLGPISAVEPQVPRR